MLRRLVVTTLFLAFASAACSTGATGSTRSPAAPSGAPSMGAPSDGSDLDKAFIDMMVPHHRAAIAMAGIAKERATRDELRSLADDIIAAQESEIAQLLAWRTEWYGDATVPGMDAMPLLPGMEMPGMEGMDGPMDMTADIDALRTAEPFDRAFIEAMIVHHTSAIEAAGIAAAATSREEIKTVAADIIEAQQREIDQMQGWLNDWYPN